MFDPQICAARYQFLEEAWVGRDRVVYDSQLVKWLSSSPVSATETSWGRLLADVLPSRPGQSVVWAVVPNPEDVVRHASSLRGCRLVTLEQAFDLGADALWSVAMVDVSGDLRASSQGDEETGAIRCASAVAGLVERFVEELGRGRTMCVSVGGAAARSHSGEQVFDLFDELVPDAKSYMLAKPTIAVVYPLGADEDEDEFLQVSGPPPGARTPWTSRPRDQGPSSESDYDKDLADAEESWTGQWRGSPTRPPEQPRPESEERAQISDDSEGVGVGYDNSIGDEEPEAHTWLAVLGRASVDDDVVLVDLGSPAPSAALSDVVRVEDADDLHRRRGQSDDSSQVRELKARLNQARLRADAAVIEHHRLTEVVHALQQRSEDDRPFSEDSAGLEAELTSAQWSLAQANDQVEALRGRPVTELEALVCSLRAQIEKDRGVATLAPQKIQVARDRGPLEPQAGATVRCSPSSKLEPGPSQSARRARERAALKSLLRKLERGGGSAFEFHAELRAILAMVERP